MAQEWVSLLSANIVRALKKCALGYDENILREDASERTLNISDGLVCASHGE